jgi:hypothetical protein
MSATAFVTSWGLRSQQWGSDSCLLSLFTSTMHVKHWAKACWNVLPMLRHATKQLSAASLITGSMVVCVWTIGYAVASCMAVAKAGAISTSSLTSMRVSPPRPTVGWMYQQFHRRWLVVCTNCYRSSCADVPLNSAVAACKPQPSPDIANSLAHTAVWLSK